MTTIVPQSELTKKAVTWIGEQREESDLPLKQLIEKAAMQFNLSPADVEFLTRFYKENPE